MNTAFTNATNFYRDNIAPRSLNPNEETTFPLSRLEFNFGAVLSTAYLIKALALTTFTAIGTLLTLAQNQSLNSSLKRNFEDSLKNLMAIAIGLAGLIVPGTINQKILEIPPEGLKVPLQA